MKLHEAFPSRFLEAAELEGEELTLTIDRYEKDVLVGRDNEPCIVIYFKETNGRGMVLNKTNAHRIANLHGRVLEGWADSQITILPSTTDFQGKTVPCIRVKE